jgi:hypothetical protein
MRAIDVREDPAPYDYEDFADMHWDEVTIVSLFFLPRSIGQEEKIS